MTTFLTSYVAFTAGYNGDRESDYSVTITGHVACLVALSGFDLRPRKDTASWRTFLAGEELTRVQLEPSLITGEGYLLVNIDTESFEYAIDGMLLKYIVDKQTKQQCLICTFMGYALIAFVGSLKRTWRGVGSLSPYSWISRVSTHVTTRVQRTSPDHTNANMA